MECQAKHRDSRRMYRFDCMHYRHCAGGKLEYRHKTQRGSSRMYRWLHQHHCAREGALLGGRNTGVLYKTQTEGQLQTVTKPKNKTKQKHAGWRECEKESKRVQTIHSLEYMLHTVCQQPTGIGIHIQNVQVYPMTLPGKRTSIFFQFWWALHIMTAWMSVQASVLWTTFEQNTAKDQTLSADL